MTTGQLIVITGPSGVGKGTLVRRLLSRHPRLYLSISATTRPPRPGEIDGKDYFFVSQATFQGLIEHQELLEWAEYAGNYYGTPRESVLTRLEQGQSVLLEIEVQGAKQIQANYPAALRIFILPPSLEELERRLVSRGKDSPEVIARRLAKAQEELALSAEFDQQILNQDLDAAYESLERAIFGRKS